MKKGQSGRGARSGEDAAEEWLNELEGGGGALRAGLEVAIREAKELHGAP